MNNEYSEGKAIPFITYNSLTQKFEFNRESEKIIGDINGEFSVISIVGAYRSGKSYLLNKMLLNYSKGFSVGKTVNACTKGIWIWSKPLIGVSPEGKTIPVLLLDTEGFGSHDSDLGHDSKIFTLAVLLSSLFMYNSVGVIDENVLDSLGFICNLGKLIGSKTMNLSSQHHNQNQNNSQEGAQSEGLFEDIFPSLLWVLRDFTLQLLDDDGSNLTATDYLEKVLNFIPKGKSSSESLTSGDSATKTNKESVRDTIKTYFKSRECMIMVRPINSEKDLQNLDEISDEKIRPDFLQQVLSLRKKLFNNCKPKTFNGIKLNSESYLSIITEYIEVMNSGKLPTIDSIWNNICKYESQKALDEAENIYEEFLRETLNKKCVDDKEIEKLHEQAKQISLDVFKRKSLGDISNAIRKTLKKKIDEKLVAFSKQNEEENKNEIFNFMKNNFNRIEIKLKKNEINSLDDLQNEILQVENKCVDAFPNTRIRGEMILDFKYKVIFFASNYIVSKLLDEKQFLCEKIEQEKSQNCESKEKLNSDLFKLLDESKRLQLNLNFLKEELLLNKEKCLIYEKDKEQIIAGYEEKIKSAKDENLKLVSELNEKYALKEKQYLESEKRLFEAREKYEKEKAQLDVKIEFLTKSLNELASKEKEKNLEAEMNLKEQIVLNKNALANFEDRIKELLGQNESLTDKINELENKLFKKDNLFEMEKNKYEDTVRKLCLEKLDLTEKLKAIKFQFENSEAKLKQELQLKESEIAGLKNKLKLKEEENLAETKLLEDNLKSNLLKAEKELSLQLQNNQFLEFKCHELSNQVAELKTNYENAISVFEKKMLTQNENLINGKNEEMKNYYLMEKKQLEDNFTLEKNMLHKEIQSLANKNLKQEEINKAIIEELEKTNKEYKENLDKLKHEITSLQNQKQKLEEEKSLLHDENSLKFKKFMEDFEKKTEEKDAFYRRDIEIINKSCEDTIANYKTMFENEKNRLEEKIRDEKLKYDKKLKYTQDEYEIKLRDVEKELKSEIENLKFDYEELEETHKNYIMDAENEIRILNQKINNLESSLKESKDCLATFQSQYNTNLDKKTESFNNERKELLKRLETLTAENNQKDQELTGLRFKAEQMEKQISEFNQILKKEKDSGEEIKNELTEKYENMKKKYQEITDEFLFKKLESTRESSLLKQQIEFVNKKLEEMTKNNEENDHYVESIMFTTKREVEAEYNSKMDSNRKEKEELVAKLANKKREHRELEQAFLKQTCIYDKEKQQLNEKVSSLESKMKEICEHYKSELDRISLDMNGLREESDSKANELKSQIEALRDKNLELERENKSMLTKKSDWKTKTEFLENQIEDSKISMIEMQSKCETFLKNALAKGQAEKEHIEKEYQEKLSFLEHNYFSALQKMEEENRRLNELTRDHKEIEDELINLSRQASTSLKMNDPVLISKKIQELLNVQDSLRKELEEIRLEKDKKIAELISKHEREKEIYNIKLIEYEVKMKNYANYYGSNGNSSHMNSAAAGFDQKRSNESNNYFDLEKEKGKWKAEKEKLLGFIGNLNSQIQKIEKKSDYLHKENEQLRNSQNNFPILGEMNKMSAADYVNKNFANSSNNINNNNFSNNDGAKFSPNRFSKTSRHNVSTLNDKEILLDNLKRNNHLNLNMHLMNSPLGENRKSNLLSSNNNLNFNNAYTNDENNATREHQIFKEINSPNILHDIVNRKESFIHKINVNVAGGNNNGASKFSPFKIKK